MKAKNKLSILVLGIVLSFIMVGTIACGNKEAKNVKEWSVVSPNKNLEVSLFFDSNGCLSYKVDEGETAVLEISDLGFELEEEDLSQALTYVSEERNEVSGTYTNKSGKRLEVDYAYQELKLTFSGQLYYLDVITRTYDDGYAFRYGIRAIDGSEGTITVLSEDTEFGIPADSVTWAQAYQSNTPEKGDFFSYEEAYTRRKSDNLSGVILVMPVMYRAGQSDIYSLVSESQLIGSGFYGSFLREEKANEGTGILHTIHNVAGVADPDNIIQLPFQSPWRVAAVGSLSEVCESEIVEKVYDNVAYWKPDDYDSLSEEEKQTYTYDWVEPGVVGWNWLAYKETKSQSDWELQTSYVDLAQEMGWSYVILDGGWDQTEVNVKRFTEYASKKGIKVIVWCDAFNLFKNGDVKLLEKRLSHWKSWGIAGIKIDFFDGQESTGLTHQGEDIETIKWYESIYQICAKLRMVVNCHGCNKPTGENRVYPNVLNREAIYGNELWPRADVTVNSMFIRNVIGPTDFTPMVKTPNGGLTVAHEMALAVLYQSGMPSMADFEETYRNELIKDFYMSVPAKHDDTKFLCGELDGYYCAAVKSGDTWFVAGINSSGINRTAELDFLFLNDGAHHAVIYEDSVDGTKIIEKREESIDSQTSLAVEMQASGGFVIIIK